MASLFRRSCFKIEQKQAHLPFIIEVDQKY